MKIIAQQEKDTLTDFIERNVRFSSDVESLDEGIGTIYERTVMDTLFRNLITNYKIKKLLEHPADGVTGIPGINSLEFARQGCRVYITNPSELMLDKAVKVWKKKNLIKFLNVKKCEIDKIPYPKNYFDLVWNFCIFERFHNPETILKEMKRVSKRYLLIITQNKYNFGTFIHKIYHFLLKKKWDHGFEQFMTVDKIIQSFKKCGLEVITFGAIDTPPWVDTWDMPLRGKIKKILSPFGLKWEWNSKNSSKKKTGYYPLLLKFLIWLEGNIPDWFNLFQTHHLYVLGRKI